MNATMRNTGEILGRTHTADAHVMARLLRSVTVVFWPVGARYSSDSQWSSHQPELTDAEMAGAAQRLALGLPGKAYIYRGAPSCVNTTRDDPSAVVEV